MTVSVIVLSSAAFFAVCREPPPPTPGQIAFAVVMQLVGHHYSHCTEQTLATAVRQWSNVAAYGVQTTRISEECQRVLSVQYSPDDFQDQNFYQNWKACDMFVRQFDTLQRFNRVVAGWAVRFHMSSGERDTLFTRFMQSVGQRYGQYTDETLAFAAQEWLQLRDHYNVPTIWIEQLCQHILPNAISIQTFNGNQRVHGNWKACDFFIRQPGMMDKFKGRVAGGHNGK